MRLAFSWRALSSPGSCVLLAACEVYLQRIKPPPPDEAPPAPGPGNQAGLPSPIGKA
jgi:hypothetical protein